MEEQQQLRQTFLFASISDLKKLQTRLIEDARASEFQRELFRTLHTIKGTAQTFGLHVSAMLAHTLENLLSAAKNNSITNEEFEALCSEGVEVLINSLAEKDFQIPTLFSEKIEPFRSESAAETDQFSGFLSGIPESIILQLSEQEKSVLSSAVEDGNDLAVLEIGFDAANFAEDFKKFRERLHAKGEIIASLPSAKFMAQSKVGFQIVFVTREEYFDALDEYSEQAEVVFQLYQTFSNNLPGILQRAVSHGKTLAAGLGKTIEFESVLEVEPKLSPQTLKIIFDALLHLIRNAVDHGIEREGKIKIEIRDTDDSAVSVKVSDDGRGIDAEKIRRKAIEKNLISASAAAEDLTETEILHLIFAHGFSTSDAVTEISGRGVGLDAVKDMVEKAGGEIFVRSSSSSRGREEGTTFEILLKNI